MEHGADVANTGYTFPDMLCDMVCLSTEGRREEAHDLFDAHLPLLRYEQQPGVRLSVRKYILFRCGLLGTPALRAPAVPMGEAARREVEHRLARLAHHGPRAQLDALAANS